MLAVILIAIFLIDFAVKKIIIQLFFDFPLYFLQCFVEMMEVDEEVDLAIESHRNNMIDHAFLPRKLSEKSLDLHATEHSLLRSVASTIELLENEIFPVSVRQMFANMEQLHCDDALDPKAISKQMRNLKMGDMMGIYVREQNCGLFLHMADADEVTMSTFSASLPNEMIYGDGINGDIQVRSLGRTQFVQDENNYDFLRLIIRRVRSKSNCQLCSDPRSLLSKFDF